MDTLKRQGTSESETSVSDFEYEKNKIWQFIVEVAKQLMWFGLLLMAVSFFGGIMCFIWSGGGW